MCHFACMCSPYVYRLPLAMCLCMYPWILESMCQRIRPKYLCTFSVPTFHSAPIKDTHTALACHYAIPPCPQLHSIKAIPMPCLPTITLNHSVPPTEPHNPSRHEFVCLCFLQLYMIHPICFRNAPNMLTLKTCYTVCKLTLLKQFNT